MKMVKLHTEHFSRRRGQILVRLLHGWGRFIIIAFKPLFTCIPGPCHRDGKKSHIFILIVGLLPTGLTYEILKIISKQTEIINKLHNIVVAIDSPQSHSSEKLMGLIKS